jgi:hypothetical protein
MQFKDSRFQCRNANSEIQILDILQIKGFLGLTKRPGLASAALEKLP